MDVEAYRDFCLGIGPVTEDLPFGPDTLVFRVGGRIFALCGLAPFTGINLKCAPDRAVELREQYAGIRPGYHMNKKHWNTVSTDGSVPDELIRQLTLHSFSLVLESLPSRERAKLTKSPLIKSGAARGSARGSA